MKVLYIFGNGFDKAHGLKTSYPEFYEHLLSSSNNPYLCQIKQEISQNIDLWSDMEEAFGRFTYKLRGENSLKNTYFNLNESLQEYLNSEQKRFLPTERLKTKFIKDLEFPESYLNYADRVNYLNRIPNQSQKTINIITLNYTNTIEKLLGCETSASKCMYLSSNTHIDDIIHVHGKLEDSIVLGVYNKDQITNNEFKDSQNAADCLIKKDSIISMESSAYNKFNELVKGADVIVFYGVSFGATDTYLWKLVGEKYKKKKLIMIIHLYANLENNQTRKHLYGSIRRMCQEKLNELTNNSFSDADRIFFVINSNIFRL